MAGRHGDDLKHTKNEISELTRLIQRLRSEIESVKKQVKGLWGLLAHSQGKGELSITHSPPCPFFSGSSISELLSSDRASVLILPHLTLTRILEQLERPFQKAEGLRITSLSVPG